MRPPGETAIRVRRGVLLLAALLIGSACSTGRGGGRPVPTLVREPDGFTVREEARVSAGVRADFEGALRLLENGEYEEGIALLVEVTEAAPHLTAPHIDLAIAYRRRDDLGNAKESIERALALDPRHPVAHNELGIIHRRMGEFDRARKSYEKALELYPDFHFARRNLGILCDVYLSDPDCALEHYRKYLEAVPDDEAVAIWVADLSSRTAE